jgi:hypothetical protein
MDLLSSRAAAANIERWLYREIGSAETEADVAKARDVLRLAVGLRRKLEMYPGIAATSATPKE